MTPVIEPEGGSATSKGKPFGLDVIGQKIPIRLRSLNSLVLITNAGR